MAHRRGIAGANDRARRYSRANVAPMESDESRINEAMKMPANENPARAIAFLPNRIPRYVAHNTPMTVTNWLDMLNRLYPTSATFVFSALIISPKEFSRLCHQPPPASLVNPSV